MKKSKTIVLIHFIRFKIARCDYRREKIGKKLIQEEFEIFSFPLFLSQRKSNKNEVVITKTQISNIKKALFYYHDFPRHLSPKRTTEVYYKQKVLDQMKQRGLELYEEKPVDDIIEYADEYLYCHGEKELNH